MELRNNSANIGLNTNSIPLQIKPGELTHAMNAVVAGFDGNSVTYQNEQANELCVELPDGYTVIGRKVVQDKNIILFFLVGAQDSQIGIVEDCTFRTFIKAPCLNFSIDHPIKKVEVRRSQVYFTD